MMIAHAARPTERIANAENRNTRVTPAIPPTNTSGFARSTLVMCAASRYAEKRRKAARAALPTAYPFVSAFVVFPAASSLSICFRTVPEIPAISTIPAALSAIGPNVSIARMYAAVESIPIVAIAVPNRPPPIENVRETKTRTPVSSPR